MPEGHGDSGVEVRNARQQDGAGPSRTSSAKSDAAAGRRPVTRRVLQQRQQHQQLEEQQQVQQQTHRQQPRQQRQRQDVIDLTEDRPDDDDVQITRVVKRPRVRSPRGALALNGLPPAAALALASLMQPGGVAAMPLLTGAAPGGAAALATLNPIATAAAVPAAAAVQPPAPPSPKGYKCTICLDRMEGDLATTTCGCVTEPCCWHMFCYKCITAWVQKSGNCPQCRSKLNKGKIIRIYPPS